MSESSQEKKPPPIYGTTLLESSQWPQSQKAVTISEEPEEITPSTNLEPTSHSPKQHRASISGRKMTGRMNVDLPARPTSLTQNISYLKLDDAAAPSAIRSVEVAASASDSQSLLAQVTEWLIEERGKRYLISGPPERGDLSPKTFRTKSSLTAPPPPDQDLALDKLEQILASFRTKAPGVESRPLRKASTTSLRRGSVGKYFKKSEKSAASSDTEWIDGDINVPHVEAYLDNSRTMTFTGGEADTDTNDAMGQKDQKCWDQFKQDIVRMTHTLKIRGWRRIPINEASVIHVERLSGALTNAVYVVKPPQHLPDISANDDGRRPHFSKSRPLELLLRIYGPQVEHLIDREAELGILRRLARKKIGPRLLGYFTNGRFEEFLHATTLKPQDLRQPDTCKLIAKRMRELHDGIELLPSERSSGPRAFLNWDRWVDRVEKVITWLDMQVKREQQGHKPASKRYTRRGLVCGVEWPVFRRTFERYRTALVKDHGGDKAIQKRLVFAHNDTQYGNLMRLNPPGDSPLIQPANQHRQIVVIDFEYASANTPGYEFANHFAEWCYNYHHSSTSYACNTQYYPTPAEQYRFVRAYVMHRPQYAPAASMTPKLEGREKTSISEFMLDARTPVGSEMIDYDKEERAREQKLEDDIEYLLHETRLWRIENSAQWVAWGIVQAKVPELDEAPKHSKAKDFLEKVKEHIHIHSDPLDHDVKVLQDASKDDRPESSAHEDAHKEGDGEDDTEAEDFDYLAYAQERAMFFWGDCLQMGVVKESELPQTLLQNLKLVKF